MITGDFDINGTFIANTGYLNCDGTFDATGGNV